MRLSFLLLFAAADADSDSALSCFPASGHATALRLSAKSTSKFRPVKPQQKKAGTPSASGSATPVPPPSSGQPAPPQLAPTPSSSQVNLDAEIGAEVASVGTSTTQASREQSLFPSSRAPSASNVTSERSSTPIVPTAGPPEPPASSQPRPSIAPSIPRPSPVLSTQPPSTDTANEPTAVRNARLSVPSASTSRQGTPISLGNAGNSFSVGSWESLEATQVSSSSTQPFPSDSQQTLVPDASQSSGPAGGSLLKEIAARVANAENTSLPQEASRVTQEEPSLPAPDTSSLATASSGPSASIIPSSPALQTSSGLALPSLPPEHTEDDTHEDIDAEGEVDLPGPTDDTPTAAEADEEATEATEAAPPAKKRGRPAGKANGTKTKKAPAKPKAKRGKVATQGGGAELEGEEEATSVASAINANEAGGQAEADNAAEDSAVISKKRKRKAPAKPKASTARARAAKRVRINNTADGAEEVDGAGEEDSALEDEHYEPWYIHKVHPGYSLNTTDIFAAVGVDLPEKFDFTTAQDAAEVLEGEEVGGEEGDETLRGDEEEQAAEGEEGEYDPDAEQAQEDDQEEEEEGTTPWYPLRAPIDPTTTTMKQLAENNEGGRMASRGRTNLGDKIDRKQRLRIAREKMKLRRVLLQKGFSAEAVDRLLDEKMEEILNGGILEFTLDDLERVTVPTAMPDAEQVSRQGTLRGDTGAQPLFRPEENSDDERESRQSDEENQGENAHRNEYDDEEEGFGGIAESRYAPQMRFVNGEFVLDESSTQIVRVSYRCSVSRTFLLNIDVWPLPCIPGQHRKRSLRCR